jgi:predicted SprT family Zn-dependent metalloprotease
MTINEALRMGNEIKNKFYELKDWRITLNDRKKSFGLCVYSKREIQLSKHLVVYMSEDAVKNTIIHEIAHALTIGHGHDNVWRRRCIELGGNGNRVSGAENFENGMTGQIAYLKSISKYTLTCPTCGNTFHISRKPKHDSSCTKHGDKVYNPQHKMVLSENR